MEFGMTAPGGGTCTKNIYAKETTLYTVMPNLFQHLLPLKGKRDVLSLNVQNVSFSF